MAIFTIPKTLECAFQFLIRRRPAPDPKPEQQLSKYFGTSNPIPPVQNVARKCR